MIKEDILNKILRDETLVIDTVENLIEYGLIDTNESQFLYYSVLYDEYAWYWLVPKYKILILIKDLPIINLAKEFDGPSEFPLNIDWINQNAPHMLPDD